MWLSFLLRSPWIPQVFAVSAMGIFGVFLTVRGLVNSDIKVFARLAEIAGWNTLHRQKCECCAGIGVMKQKAFVCAVCILILVIEGREWYFRMRTASQRLAEGVYRAENCAEYPDARIIVQGSAIRFYDMDLNAAEPDLVPVYVLNPIHFSKERVDEYRNTYEGETPDWNRMLTDAPWAIDYDRIRFTSAGEKRLRAYRFAYFFPADGGRGEWGMILYYDAYERTISMDLGNPRQEITFRLQK